MNWRAGAMQKNKALVVAGNNNQNQSLCTICCQFHVPHTICNCEDRESEVEVERGRVDKHWADMSQETYGMSSHVCDNRLLLSSILCHVPSLHIDWPAVKKEEGMHHDDDMTVGHCEESRRQESFDFEKLISSHSDLNLILLIGYPFKFDFSTLWSK